jgi:hypothetical protein
VKDRPSSQPEKAPKTLIPWSVRICLLGAIAAIVAIRFFAYRNVISPQTTSSAPPTNVQLADLALPFYRAPVLRGLNGDPAFEAGMDAYAVGDCRGAVEKLSRVVPKDTIAAQFYTGVCQMHDGDMTAASANLQHVADAGDSSQQEPAMYYLAQIALAANDANMARHYLGQTISLHGDYEWRVRSELRSIRANAGRK